MDMPLGLGVAGMVTGYDVKQKTIEHEVLLDIYIMIHIYMYNDIIYIYTYFLHLIH
jgi:hypothetical protein